MRKEDSEVFKNKFEPLLDSEGDIRRFETYGEEFEEAKKLAGENCEFLWTIISGDNGKLYISAGFHLVNREYYVITKKPWKDGQRDYLWW